jgi:hypothetical protein
MERLILPEVISLIIPMGGENAIFKEENYEKG